MATLKELEKEIELLKNRNKRVEGDKAWEISRTRAILLTGFTYIGIGIYLQVLGIPDPWLNAIGASLGFVLSTLSLPHIKKRWLKRYHI